MEETETASEAVLRVARLTYDAATVAWRRERQAANIVEETDTKECDKGVTYKTMTPEAARVMGRWQKAKAELDAAVANDQNARGDIECSVCKDL